MPLAYVINELGSTVTTYRFDAQRGSLDPIQVVHAAELYRRITWWTSE